MTVDPVFHETQDLPNVDLRSTLASVLTPCSGTTTVELPGYTPVNVTQFQMWPDVAPDSMPWASRVEQILPLGSPQVLLDNRELIEQLIAEWNGGMSNTTPIQPRCYGDDEDSGGGIGDDEGCGFRTEDDGYPPALLAFFVLVGVATRRRR